MGHTVRVILTEDSPSGKNYKGEVIHVKAGFARNHLIPGKMALYATPENFQRLEMDDPDLETPEQKAARLAREALSDEGARDLKAADLLKHYLRNKTVCSNYCTVSVLYTYRGILRHTDVRPFFCESSKYGGT
jgi:hypothetical protein